MSTGILKVDEITRPFRDQRTDKLLRGSSQRWCLQDIAREEAIHLFLPELLQNFLKRERRRERKEERRGKRRRRRRRRRGRRRRRELEYR
jgi:hypothetical protein